MSGILSVFNVVCCINEQYEILVLVPFFPFRLQINFPKSYIFEAFRIYLPHQRPRILGQRASVCANPKRNTIKSMSSGPSIIFQIDLTSSVKFSNWTRLTNSTLETFIRGSPLLRWFDYVVVWCAVYLSLLTQNLILSCLLFFKYQ